MPESTPIKGPGYGFDYTKGRTRLLSEKKRVASHGGDKTQNWATKQTGANSSKDSKGNS